MPCRTTWTWRPSCRYCRPNWRTQPAAGAIDQDAATDAEYELTKAAQQAQRPTPDKQSLLGHLTAAKQLVAGATALSDLVTGLGQAIETVQHVV